MILCASTVLGVQAQALVPSITETKVSAIVEKLRVAMVSGDRNELESILSDDLTYGHSGGGIQTKAEFVEAIATKKSDFKKIDLTKKSITIQRNVAIVRHVLTADTNDGGKPAHIQLGIVLVLKKYHKDWKIIARRSFHVD